MIDRNRYQELQEQKRAIDKELRTLRQHHIVCGTALLRQHYYPTDRNGEWAVAIKMRYVGNNVFTQEKTRFFDVAISMDKLAVIAEIDNIVSDLTDLREMALQECNEEGL